MAAIVGMVLSISACDLTEMSFVQDKRLRIVEPESDSKVSMPVTLRWEVDGFDVTHRDGYAGRDRGYFAVFVDRHPLPPGKSLEWFANQAESCASGPCGSVENLTDVYTTTDRFLTLRRVGSGRQVAGEERHEAVIVLMDGTGTRIGESAFTVRFSVGRESGR